MRRTILFVGMAMAAAVTSAIAKDQERLPQGETQGYHRPSSSSEASCSTPSGAKCQRPDRLEIMDAHSVILANFSRRMCSTVTSVTHLMDGSIKAVCGEGGAFRIFSRIEQENTFRCATALKLGVTSCF